MDPVNLMKKGFRLNLIAWLPLGFKQKVLWLHRRKKDVATLTVELTGHVLGVLDVNGAGGLELEQRRRREIGVSTRTY